MYKKRFDRTIHADADTLAEMQKGVLSVWIKPFEEGWAAHAAQLPGEWACGNTPRDAIANLVIKMAESQEAKILIKTDEGWQSWLEAMGPIA